MTVKEIAELRRRLRADRHNITKVYGCYVSEKGEIIAELEESLALMPQDECEKYLAFFKKVLSGPQYKNLIEVTFKTKQVVDSEEHRLLMSLRDTELKDPDIRRKLYETIIPAVKMDSNYVILLAHEVYDVPFRAKDGTDLEDGDHTFSYFLCAVCPVKMTKPVLRYVASEEAFHNRGTDFVVSPPELGFLFPAFDGRRTNIYNALYYTHALNEDHKEFVDALFRMEPPMPAAIQKETFQSVLGESLDDECSIGIVQAVQDDLRERMDVHKASGDPEPLLISKDEVEDVLVSRGVSDEKVAAFRVQYDCAFGGETDLSPQNLIHGKKVEVCTPDVIIKVNPERSDLIETRIINGTPYVLIRAEDQVEVNGVSIHIGT